MSDAYAEAGVDTREADDAVRALVGVLAGIDSGGPSRSVIPSGHYASVLRVADDLGIAIATDGVGSKIVVAEQTGRLETVGIDCVAMNVNDLVCVGAEPIAMVDYLAVERADPQALAAIARGLRDGAGDAGIEIPGGELAVLPELIRGHPSPGGFDLCGTAIGTVALSTLPLILGARIAPGDALVGVPSSGLHSNGYTLARRVLVDDGPGLDARPDELNGATVADALLEPTVIYVRATLELLRSDVPVHGLAHITGGGLARNLPRAVGATLGIRVDPSAWPQPRVFDEVARAAEMSAPEMRATFNCGIGFAAVVERDAAVPAISLLRQGGIEAWAIGEIRLAAELGGQRYLEA